MIHIDFDPKALKGEQKTWWDDWAKSAQEATDAAIEAWEKSDGKTKPDLDSNIWRDLKEWLLKNVFNGKCAYCETDLGVTRAPGHAEHFRPKSGIKNKDDDEKKYVTGKTIDHDGNEIDHPGYFWLAYNWKNLVPSCTECNTGPGKKNQFPIKGEHILIKELSEREVKRLTKNGKAPLASKKWKGFYYLDPDHLDEEESRLLLHPYWDEPRKHIKFGEKGIVTIKNINGRKSKEGDASIDVFYLEAEGLMRGRHNEQIAAWNFCNLQFDYAIDDGKTLQEAQQFTVAKFEKRLAEKPYSAAVEDYVKLRTKVRAGIAD